MVNYFIFSWFCLLVNRSTAVETFAVLFFSPYYPIREEM